MKTFEISKYKELNSVANNKKCAEDLISHFSKQDNRKNVYHTLIIKEIKIRTAMRYFFTPIRMAIMKKSRNNKCQQSCGRSMLLLLVGM